MRLLTIAPNLRKQFTATGYVTNADATLLLMVHHKKLGAWLPPGGHVDPDESPSDTALRETWEETGICASHRAQHQLELELGGEQDFQLPSPLSMSAQLIPSTAAEGQHIHIDLMYYLVADPDVEMTPAVAEVRDVRWFSRSQILSDLNTFDSVRAFAGKVMSNG